MEPKKVINDYLDLEVWNVAYLCVLEIYRITNTFPSDERFGLTSQIRRAAYSIPANISEGNGRQHTKDYINLLYISKSSLNELKYFLLLSKALGYLTEPKFLELNSMVNRIGRMLMGLIKSLNLSFKDNH